MSSSSQLYRAAMLSGPEKLAAATSLVNKLTQDLSSSTLLSHQRDAALEELKIYGRDPRNADPIFTKDGIEMLTRHAFDSSSSTTSRNALRCLCNALYLKAETRQFFVDLGYEAKVCNKLKNDSPDDEFLVSRLLLLTTYDTDIKLERLIDEYQLADSMTKHLERHAEQLNDEKPTTDPMHIMALTETVKLLFNITFHCKEKASSLTQAIPHIVTLLCKGLYQVSKPLDPPIGPLVNALINLDLGAKDVQSSLCPSTKPTILSDRLISLLNQSKTAYQDEELENAVAPLLAAIRVLYAHAPQDVQVSIRQKLLPTEDDRNEVLGSSSSLPSWLLKNSTNAMAPKLRETIPILLFDLSDKDASKFIENVGYGFASGFLFNQNIPIPENASKAIRGDAGSSERPINPVTGQFLDSERHADVPEMTDAEKEREAEKLFVLFQRLQANGVISVENPIRTAVEQGRFEELPDDYQEDVD
ncbi:guanine nucleotide exchange factor [Xylaria bambusicola]|uniref:guanine nucleotide exchange factor n=1 Tax=Xylaria bambusicola TaxID=326684 RepID=UPI002008929D|nr:guanine nucleotide exchange factor [Xylaria bambusicola]KAI0521474.1 guanine nucleotide exchange factor [Xylaria bambusicola]